MNSSLETLIQSAETDVDAGNVREAHGTLSEIFALDPDCAKAYKILGDLYEVQSLFPEAISAYQKAIKLEPNFVEAYAYLAQVYRNTGEFDRALFCYKKALSLRPDWTALYFQLGQAYSWSGDVLKAIRCYQKTLEQNPYHVYAYFALAIAYGGLGETERAIALYQYIIKLQPDLANAYNNLGCLLFAKDDFAGAIEAWNNALKYNKKEKDNYSIYNNLGQVFAAQNKITEAIQSYYKSVKIKDDFPLIYNNLGKLYQQQNQHETAFYCFTKVIELDPDNRFAYTDCGASLLKLGRIDAALRYFQNVILREHQFITGYCQRVKEHSSDDELSLAQQACAHFLMALKQWDGEIGKDSTTIDNFLIQTYLNLGNALVTYGKFDLAVSYYQKAAQIQPQFIEIYLKLGNSLFKSQQLNAALTVYQIARTLLKSGSEVSLVQKLEVYLQLGRILEKQEDWDAAANYYNTVLQIQQQPGFQSLLSNYPLTLRLLQDWARTEVINRPQKVCDSTLIWLKNHNLQDSHYYFLSGLLTSEGKNSQGLENGEKNPGKIPTECGGLDCQPCLKRVFEAFPWKNLGHGIQKCGISENNITSTSLFVAIIPNGRAWIVPQENYWMVCKAIAIITPDNQLLADVSREYPAPLPGCPSYDPMQHQVFQTEQLPPLQQIEGRVAVLSGLSGNVYFHWMVDILPRVELLRQSGIDFNTIDWFLVNSQQASFQRETLTRLGIPTFKILESDQFPHIQAQQLIVPSYPGYMGWLQPWAIDTLRRWFLPRNDKGGMNYPERIYISRGDARYRRVLNENEVIELLHPWGFVVVQLESMSFSQQVALFSQAKVIMGAHGSGLTNIIFCQPGTQVIEWVSPHYNRHYYWVISQYLGLEHYSLTGEGFSCYPLRELMYQNSLTEDIWVNLVSLKRLLELLFVQRKQV
ncbi:tetratricopeptide repeat protein [Planktothrix mougeotii]|uniref:DUF563 domain-containing protein n=1 Tax=Planktothrix mougeotii LEGE 06226 TaxID=1828728 RepID=A0ABR9UBW1_9CYAN|nr:tetratricopeptide repeat protein [Planktothrix mougeotii]MBE9143948.1 DUF563 domain-containing protein [Planktothrix mougeotii LEGE 06226]